MQTMIREINHFLKNYCVLFSAEPWPFLQFKLFMITTRSIYSFHENFFPHFEFYPHIFVPHSHFFFSLFPIPIPNSSFFLFLFPFAVSQNIAERRRRPQTK